MKKRALRKEFNMEIRVGKFFMESVYDYSFGRFVLEVYFAACPNQEIPDLFEHEQARWVAITELTGYDFSPADIPVVEALLKEDDLASKLF